jgi:large subunit ribosomal protein L35
MPKMKPHTTSGKRFRVTGTGKLTREQPGKRHNMENKSSRVTRRISGVEPVAKCDVKRIKRMLAR